MNLLKFQRLLKEKLPNVKCYLDRVPEKKPLPAIAYMHIANSAARLLSGAKTGDSDSWRLILISEEESDLQSLVNEVETLDNTDNTDYKRVFAKISNNQSQDLQEPDRRAIVDVQTFERV